MADAKGGESFEALFEQLEEKARKLEGGNLPLAESLAVYGEGVELVDRLREMVEGAELTVEKLRARLAADRDRLAEVEEAYEAEEL